MDFCLPCGWRNTLSFDVAELDDASLDLGKVMPTLPALQGQSPSVVEAMGANMKRIHEMKERNRGRKQPHLSLWRPWSPVT